MLLKIIPYLFFSRSQRNEKKKILIRDIDLLYPRKITVIETYIDLLVSP